MASTSRNRRNRAKLTDTERRMIAAGQQWRCGQCLNLLPATFEIDHKTALVNGGLNAWSNYCALCPQCHRDKTIYDRNPSTYERVTGKSKYFAPGPLALY